MTTPNEDLEQRVAELQREALSKNLTEKIIVAVAEHPASQRTRAGFGSYLKHNQGMVLRVEPSDYEEYAWGATAHFDEAEVIYKVMSVYYCMIPRHFGIGGHEIISEIHPFVYGPYIFPEDFHKECQKKLRPDNIKGYHPGDWEQVLDKIYKEALENIDNKKAENKRDEENKKRKEEEQRIKTLRENFG